jgi:chromosome partitioning protein
MVYSTIDEVANACGVNRKKAQELLKQGEIPAILSDSRRYFTSDSMIEFAYLLRCPDGDIGRREAFLGLEPLRPQKEKAEVITVTNQKGGVGKTTVSANLAASLSKLGSRVLLVDMDAQAQASRYFKKKSYRGRSILSVFEAMRQREDVAEILKDRIERLHDIGDQGIALDILPSEILLSRGLETMRSALRPERMLDDMLSLLKEEYDWIVIDTPPYSGLSMEMAIYATDRIVLVTQAEEFSVEGLEITIGEVRYLQEQTEKELEIDKIFINSFSGGSSAEVSSLDLIMELGSKAGLDYNQITPIPNSKAVVPGSQMLQVPIMAYPKDRRKGLEVSLPILEYAADLILRTLPENKRSLK